MDRISKEQRSASMARVKSAGTGPEKAVRRALRALGLRCRFNWPGLPGKPDAAQPGKKKALFVHGCFWHAHACQGGRLPEDHREYWARKIEGNAQRDQDVLEQYAEMGWGTLVVWECELRQGWEALARRLADFFIEGECRRAAALAKAMSELEKAGAALGMPGAKRRRKKAKGKAQGARGVAPKGGSG